MKNEPWVELEQEKGATVIRFTLYGRTDTKRMQQEQAELLRRVEQLQPFKPTSYDEWEIDDEEF